MGAVHLQSVSSVEYYWHIKFTTLQSCPPKCFIPSWLGSTNPPFTHSLIPRDVSPGKLGYLTLVGTLIAPRARKV